MLVVVVVVVIENTPMCDELLSATRAMERQLLTRVPSSVQHKNASHVVLRMTDSVMVSALV